MNHATFDSKPANAAREGTLDGLRELTTAMPIVIFANAIRELMQRPSGIRASVPVPGAI